MYYFQCLTQLITINFANKNLLLNINTTKKKETM